MKKLIVLILLLVSISVHVKADDTVDENNPVLVRAGKFIERSFPPRIACIKAMENNFFSFYTIDSCTEDIKKIISKKEERNQLVENKAAEAAMRRKQQLTEQENEIKLAEKTEKEHALLEMRAGRIKIESISDAITVYGAEDGTALGSAPKIRPDGKIYYLSGIIDKPDKKLPSFVALVNNIEENRLRFTYPQYVSNEPKYFYVRLQKSLEEKYYNLAKVGSGFNLVGKYIDNMDYQTVQGEKKSMPIFDVFYFSFY